jgi:hypothetical protein
MFFPPPAGDDKQAANKARAVREGTAPPRQPTPPSRTVVGVTCMRCGSARVEPLGELRQTAAGAGQVFLAIFLTTLVGKFWFLRKNSESSEGRYRCQDCGRVWWHTIQQSAAGTILALIALALVIVGLVFLAAR